MARSAVLVRAGLLALVAAAAPHAPATAEPGIESELQSVESALSKGVARKQDLDRLADKVEAELLRLNDRLVAAARQAQQREAVLTETEGRLAKLRAEADVGRRTLDVKRRQLAGLSGALGRLVARPAEAMIASPADPLDVVHTGMLLGATIPGLKAEANRLAADIARHDRLEREIVAERARLAAANEALVAERTTLAALLEEKRQFRSQTVKERQEAGERLAALARSARDLRDLVEKMRQHEEERKIAAERLDRMVEMPPAPSAQSVVPSGVVPRPVPPPVAQRQQATHSSLPRLADGPSIEARKGRLAFPAAGAVTIRYGQANELGITEKGIVIDTRERAQVVAPFDGKIIYAGPFRGYGLILIIEHGEGYHTLLAGMESVDAQLGQGVLAGEPVGRMGRDPVTVDGRRGLYLEFRHNGDPIDPLPWLSARSNKVAQ